jgi:hypothetical protein
VNKVQSAKRRLSPVAVMCTNQACGHHQFLSTARDHTRCPVCKRNLRVKRGPRHVSYTGPAESAAHVRQEPVPALSSGKLREVRAPRPIAPYEDDDDDGYAYILGADGKPVLADLAPDGHLTPVTLVDLRFRLLAPGCCSVYGCQEPARRIHDGWPVCNDCRIWLAG